MRITSVIRSYTVGNGNGTVQQYHDFLGVLCVNCFVGTLVVFGGGSKKEKLVEILCSD